jgi:alpha-amylase
MTRRSLSILAVSLLLVLSCGTGPNAFALKRRAVTPPSPRPSGPVQWQHDWAEGAVFYEVFVRSFYDSNGDGIGDINGLISKLDYLNDGNPATTQDLGVDALWLMPIFQSPSYHGYDTVDYETIEQDYGTNEDFQRLLDEAHRRGIRVIVDFVVNHSSNQHPWFLESASSPTSPKRDWYTWSPTSVQWSQPWGGGQTWHERNGAWYYGVFWSGMPDINWRNPEAKAEMLRIAKMWLQRGVDGYRLDATRYLVETGGGSGQSDTADTHQALKDLARVVRETKPDAIVVAENWTETPIIATYYGSTSTVAGGDEMPMNFDFPLAAAIVQGVNSGSATPIALKLREVLRTYPAGVLDAPFLTNHDQRRLASELSNNAAKQRSAASVLLTLPGAPFLYYGEEVGLQNGPTGGDESKRTPMPWTQGGGFTSGSPWFQYAPGTSSANVASQTNDPGSLLSRYRNFIRVRKASPALREGSLEMLDSTSGQVLAFLRRTDNETVLVLHNVGDSFVTAGPLAVSAAGLDAVLVDSGVNVSGGNNAWNVALPPRTSGVFRLR